MTFMSLKVYLLEISASLLLHSHKTENERARVYSLISDLSKDMVSPRLGTRKDPICHFMHYCISPPPSHFRIIQDHSPYSLKMSSRHCLLMPKQTKLALGTEQVAAACTGTKKPSGFPVMSQIYFLFSRTSQYWRM